MANKTQRKRTCLSPAKGALLLVVMLVLASMGHQARGYAGSPQGKIKHVVVVIMQNASFDHLFGTFHGANGIRAGVPSYSQKDAAGKTVTPFLLKNTAPPDLPHVRQDLLRAWDQGKMDKYAFYNGDLSTGYYDNTIAGMGLLWNWARQYSLADNFFPSVMGDAPSNQLYLVAADDDNNPFSLQPFFGPCNNQAKVKIPYSFPHVGDELARKGLTWAWYQEILYQCGKGYKPQQNPFQYFIDAHNSPNVRDFSAFAGDLSAGKLPSLVFVQPGPLHSMHPDPGVTLAMATTWLDGFIHKIQASPVWPNTAIIVIWDSSGGWWDHVPPPQADGQGYGPRVPMLVISPFAKRGYVSHVQMDDVSILRFVQEAFGVAPLNARNQLGNDLSDMFSF
jgi:phospholipase C